MLVSSKLCFEFEDRLLIVRFLFSSLTDRMEIDRIGKEIIRRISPVHSTVILDCSKLTSHVSSPFLGMMVHLQKAAQEKGLKFMVCGLNEHLMEVVHVAKLNKVLAIYANVDEAVAKVTKRNRPSFKKLITAVRESDKKGPLVAVIAIPLLLLGAFLLWVTWRPSEGPRQATVARGKEQLHASQATLRGRIVYTSRGVDLPDGGALVVAWPVDHRPSDKARATSILAFLDTEDNHLFFSTVADDGSFQLDVGFDNARADFHVLILSDHVRRPTAVLPHDRELVSDIVDDADALLRQQKYIMRRKTLKADGSAQILETFEHDD